MLLSTNYESKNEYLLDCKVLQRIIDKGKLQVNDNEKEEPIQGYSEAKNVHWDVYQNESICSIEELVQERNTQLERQESLNVNEKLAEGYEEDEYDTDEEMENYDEQEYIEEEDDTEEDEDESEEYDLEEENEEYDLDEDLEEENSEEEDLDEEDLEEEEIVSEINRIVESKNNSGVVIDEVPKTLVEFLRKYNYSDINVVLKYFSKKEIDRATSIGQIYMSRNKLFI